jgi:predicted MFS family arabinose efflux permease
VLRRRYWLYYLLTFLSGARRQIFVVFAAFLMVEKFGYSASEVTLLFLINYAFNWFFAERIGALIHRIGERRALTIEYIGLIFVFIAYGLVDNATLAAALYVIDHMFFAMAIAISTYFQKIADPKDMASTCRRLVHHQPHCRYRHSSGLRIGVDVVPRLGVLRRCGLRPVVVDRGSADSFRPRSWS